MSTPTITQRKSLYAAMGLLFFGPVGYGHTVVFSTFISPAFIANFSGRVSSLDVLLLLLVVAVIAIIYFLRRAFRKRNERHHYTNVSSPQNLSHEVAVTAITQIESSPVEQFYLDSADLLQLFNISNKTLYRWRKNGTIPYTNMGGRLLYPKKAVLGILQQRLDNKYDPIHIKAHQKADYIGNVTP